MTSRDKQTLIEHSPVGDSASNGSVENAVRKVEGQIRVLKLLVESNYKVKLQIDHCIFPWLVECAGFCINRFEIGKIDFLNDTAQVRIFYYAEEQEFSDYHVD